MRHIDALTAAKTWLVALGLAVLVVAPGCGAKEDPVTDPNSQTAAGGSAEPLPSVEGAEEGEYVAWLKANGLTREPVQPDAATRGPTGADAAIWPLHPRREVRLEGLQTWRIQVDQANLQPGGHVEFRKGKEVLWRDGAPVLPGAAILKGGLPSTVVAALKTGDTVTWGVVYGDKRDATTTFKIVGPSTGEKVEKQVARLQKDRKNAKQAPLVKRLGRDQVLVNNSLYAEALADYLDITEQSPAVFEAWLRIVECLRGLDLKDSHLYQEASLQLQNTPRARPVPSGLGLGEGGPGIVVPRPSGAVPARAQALLVAQGVADNRAKLAAEEASRASQAADVAAQKLAEAKQALDGAKPGEQGAAEYARAYERARAEAEATKLRAEEAGRSKVDQGRLAEFLRKMGAPLPGDVPDPQVSRDVLQGWVSGLKQAADAKKAEASALTTEAARAAAAGGPGHDVDVLKERARVSQEEADALFRDAELAARAVAELAP